MKYNKEDERRLVKILRFGSEASKSFHKCFLSYAAIGAFIHKSSIYVRNICLDIEEEKKKRDAKVMKVKTRKQIRKSYIRKNKGLTPNMIRYLAHPGTLKAWTGFSLP